ncbi:DNA helicase PcrA [Carboxydochorda subterranea]|uniref:ATP-dependent DNA helicase n=1 Tax=Carboxydichorda subterranea TaxID=3109565 RepID=A0ABZ1BW82_9FIRM|nr:DNA helicase PcrA [Limnochorda sp. L945t]WRP16363.1 DNA helicase PcrA [Limnochorda sp. L945t]
MPFLQGLNEAQREAVQHVEGPLLVVAGPGSGKTRVLTYRVAYLIATGAAAPDEILAVTFTNKAAQQMVQRLRQLLGPGLSERAWVGTFHATCVQILRRDGPHVGVPHDFAIFDTPDQVQVMREALKALNIDPKRYDPRGVLAACSRWKNELIGPEQAAAEARSVYDRTVARAFERYQQLMREARALDFDDLLVETVRLLREHPAVLEKYQRRFRFILVDEYQDTNHAQYQLVRLLSQAHRNLMVVGDEMQSIYGWRGADIRNILSFERDYPGARVVRLEQNYRSTKTIVEAANRLIRHNTERLDKRLWTHNAAGAPITFCRAEDERGEATFVALQILRGVQEGKRSWDSFVLLYRTHAQSRTFEEAFLAHQIPYRIVAGLRFYERKEIKDILAYLRLIASPGDVVSLRRIVNVPRRGVGETTVERLVAWARQHGVEPGDGAALEAACEAGVFTRPVAQAMRAFAGQLVRWRALAGGTLGEHGLTGLVEQVIKESGYLDMLKQERTEEAQARIENLEELLSLATRWEQEHPEGGLDDFLAHVALMSDVDDYDESARVVTLMTLHSAKGLEFPVVFLVGMEEGILPHARSTFEASDLEEERRLCYVGVTRAKEKLYLTCARSRVMWGQLVANPVSRFVDEMPREAIEDVSETWSRERVEREALSLAQRAGAAARGAASIGPAPQATGRGAADGAGGPAPGWKPGDRVVHDSFGEGTVVAVDPSGRRDAILTVAFEGAGIKRLMASVAPIRRA